MKTSRILINQNGVDYRFLRFERSSDGSIMVIVDRDSSPGIDVRRSFSDGRFLPTSNPDGKREPHARWTVHTSGIVNYRQASESPRTQRIQPLYELTQNWLIGWVSIPAVSRLTPLDHSRTHLVQGTIDVPHNFNERITLGILVCPSPPVSEISEYWLALNFETYSIVVTPVPLPFDIGPDISEHFIYCSVAPQTDSFPGVGVAEAELKFYQKVHGHGVKVFHQEDGSYVVLAPREMVKPPTLKVGFDRDDLRIELIHSQKSLRHKVRFWICDKGGRNKTDDLHKHIVSMEFDSRL